MAGTWTAFARLSALSCVGRTEVGLIKRRLPFFRRFFSKAATYLVCGCLSLFVSPSAAFLCTQHGFTMNIFVGAG